MKTFIEKKKERNHELQNEEQGNIVAKKKYEIVINSLREGSAILYTELLLIFFFNIDKATG